MSTNRFDSLSPFGRLAVKLDGDFTELERIGGQLQRMEIDTDSGLEKALALLQQFAQYGQSLADGIREFSKSLQDVHDRSEAATRSVAERAQQIQERKLEQNRVQPGWGQSPKD